MHASKPRVLIVAKAYPPIAGGVETYSEQLAMAYERAGYAPTVLTQTEGPAGWQSRRYGTTDVSVLNVGPGSQLQVAWRLSLEYRRLKRRKSFDLIHSTTWRPALSVLGARAIQPLIITVHGREVTTVPKPVQPLMRLVVGRSNVLVAVSSSTLEKAKGALAGAFLASNWVVSGNGISYAESARTVRELPALGPGLRILTVARLVPRKNVEAAVRAVSDLIDANPGLRVDYRIIGKGPRQGAVEREVERLGKADSITVMGYRPDGEVLENYRWANVFLHPQVEMGAGGDFEGFGLTIADAMSFGCVAVAGAGPGPSDFVIDGVTGVIVRGEVEDSIREGLQKLTDDALRSRLSRAGRDYVLTNLSWDKHVARILERLSVAEKG